MRAEDVDAEIEEVLRLGRERPLPDERARPFYRRLTDMLAEKSGEDPEALFNRVWEERQRGLGREA